MAKKEIMLVLDTETCNTLIGENGKLNMTRVLPYDLGFRVVDWKGKEYTRGSFVIREIYCGCPELMKSAYYADKLPMYEEDLKNGKRLMIDAYDLKAMIRRICKNFNVTAIVAHNAQFDVRALNNLVRYLSDEQDMYFLPYGIDVWDTMQMSRSVIGKMPTYKKFCEQNGYKTKNNQLRFTAEILYRYITNDIGFEESHTGLEDVLIESEIAFYCKKQKKKMKKNAFKKK